MKKPDRLPSLATIAALAPPVAVQHAAAQEQTIYVAARNWNAVIRSMPHYRADSSHRIETAGHSIIVRARKLSQESALNFVEVAKFLFQATLKWAEQGKPLNYLVTTLPNTLTELGALKMAIHAEEVSEKMGRKN